MSLNYELAKELKDAGFPQKEVTPSDVRIAMDYEEDEVVTYPTISELIEACGDMFGQLCKYDPDKGHLFFAIGEYPRWEIEGESRVIRTEPYSTPEEAVYNLYVALNEK